MSARDLAIGLLLGGGGNNNEFFHKLIDESIPIFSHDINSTYSFDVKAWFMGYPEQEPYQYLSTAVVTNIINLVKYDSASSTLISTAQVLRTYTVPFAYLVVIVKKNNNPIYATFTGYTWALNAPRYRTLYMSGDERDPDYTTVREDAAQLIYGYYRVKSTAVSGTAAPVPTVNTQSVNGYTTSVVTGNYTGGCSLDFTYDQIDTHLVMMDFDEERQKRYYYSGPNEETSVSSGTLNADSVNILPRGYGTYYEISNSELEAELQNVINAIREEANLTTYNAKVIYPDDIVYYP